MNRSHILIGAILLLNCVASFAQEDVFVQYKQKYPDEPAVFVERSEVMTINVDGDSLRVFSDVLEDIVHLKDQSDVYASKKVYGSHFNQVENIKAKTLLWEKNRYKEMAVSDFKKSSDRGQGIFFDDSYYYSFNFPAVALRNRTQLEYREHLKDARFMSGFVFTSYLPQGKVSYVVKAPREVELFYKTINDSKGLIKFKKTEKGGTVTYEWTAADVPTINNEERSPAVRYIAPHVICYVKSYQTKKGKINVLSNLDDLYKWYYTFVRDLKAADSQELSAIVKEIKSKSKDEMDLVKNVFYWVQENIQYIAFEQGMRGLIPHTGSYVCEKRYGDCKDMANLIVTMLRGAGVTAYHTWIGTRDLPYRYTEVPTPLVDNHMIATYVAKDGKYYFLDATSDHTPFGFPSSMIQGKEALIGINATQYEVREVPLIAMARNFMTDSMKITLNNNVLTGSGTTTLNGFSKVFGGYELDRSEKEDVKNYVTKLVGKGNNKFFLDNYGIKDLENRDKPTRIDYNFRIADYHQKIGDEIYINLNLNKDYYNAAINEALRKTPYENEYQYIKFENIDFVIPDGYAIEYLPESFSFNHEMYGCEIRYEQKGNTVLYSKKFYLNFLLMNNEHFTRWNEAIRAFSEAYKESIILKKK